MEEPVSDDRKSPAVAFPGRKIPGGFMRLSRRCPDRHRQAYDRATRMRAEFVGTTRLSNAHSKGERRLLYAFHPWSGQDVAVDGVVVKGGTSVARCRLAGDATSLPLEVPLWMFDRAACSAVRKRERPHVDRATLEALAGLLSRAVPDETRPSRRPRLPMGVQTWGLAT